MEIVYYTTSGIKRKKQPTSASQVKRSAQEIRFSLCFTIFHSTSMQRNRKLCCNSCLQHIFYKCWLQLFMLQGREVILLQVRFAERAESKYVKQTHKCESYLCGILGFILYTSINFSLPISTLYPLLSSLNEEVYHYV